MENSENRNKLASPVNVMISDNYIFQDECEGTLNSKPFRRAMETSSRNLYRFEVFGDKKIISNHILVGRKLK